MVLTKRMIDIVQDFYKIGLIETEKKWDVKESTIRRYMSVVRGTINYSHPLQQKKAETDNVTEIIDKDKDKNKYLAEIGERYSVDELKTLIKGFDPSVNNQKKIYINTNRDNNSIKNIKIGILSDTHVGSVYFHEEWWDEAIREFENNKVDFICHVGDLVEGLSERKGHWYDLTHIGYESQKKYAIELLNKTKIPIYGIDGNHDRWYIKSANALICQDISNSVENYTFIGSDEGDIYLNENVFIKLWHGEDGNSYAISYRVQKLIESFTPGTEPDLLLLGHVHKAVYLPAERNIYAISAGAMCEQSKWMRSKKLSNHSGYWIADIQYDENRIISCKAEFFQLTDYEKDNRINIKDRLNK